LSCHYNILMLSWVRFSAEELILFLWKAGCFTNR